MKNQKGGKFEEVLSLILHKVKDNKRVLKEIKENVLMLNHMKKYHFIFIQLLESQIDQVLSCLYPKKKRLSPSDTMEKPMNEV